MVLILIVHMDTKDLRLDSKDGFTGSHSGCLTVSPCEAQARLSGPAVHPFFLGLQPSMRAVQESVIGMGHRYPDNLWPQAVSVRWVHLHTFCTGTRFDGMPGEVGSVGVGQPRGHTRTAGGSSLCATMFGHGVAWHGMCRRQLYCT